MKVVALKANKNKHRKFSNSTTVYNGLYFVPVWASTSTNPMSLQITVLTRLLVHCQIAPRQTTLDLNTRKILLKFCSLDIKITTNRLREQKGSVIAGLGTNISLPHCLATDFGFLAPKAVTEPKSRETSLGTILWHHVQRNYSLSILFAHALSFSRSISMVKNKSHIKSNFSGDTSCIISQCDCLTCHNFPFAVGYKFSRAV